MINIDEAVELWLGKADKAMKNQDYDFAFETYCRILEENEEKEISKEYIITTITKLQKFYIKNNKVKYKKKCSRIIDYWHHLIRTKAYTLALFSGKELHL